MNYSKIIGSRKKRERNRRVLLSVIFMGLLLSLLHFEITRLETHFIKSALAKTAPQIIKCNFEFEPLLISALED